MGKSEAAKRRIMKALVSLGGQLGTPFNRNQSIGCKCILFRITVGIYITNHHDAYVKWSHRIR